MIEYKNTLTCDSKMSGKSSFMGQRCTLWDLTAPMFQLDDQVLGGDNIASSHHATGVLGRRRRRLSSCACCAPAGMGGLWARGLVDCKHTCMASAGTGLRDGTGDFGGGGSSCDGTATCAKKGERI